MDPRPIDGTKTFVAPRSALGTLVALAEGEKGARRRGVLPRRRRAGGRSESGGCFWNGKPARVSGIATLSGAAVMATDARMGTPAQLRGLEALSSRAGLVRTWGDCYGYLLVATGRAEAMVDSVMAPWDAAALQPIIEEAGGVFTDWSGRRTAFGGSSVATNAALATEVRTALGVQR